jgi:hypothetical protein
MKWEHVFNTSHKWWGDIEKAALAAQKSGYKFFSWNGRIYDITSDENDIVASWVDTGILVESCK